ncbi:MAG: hypothetical protein QW768_05095 [Thermoproteota archaeon]
MSGNKPPMGITQLYPAMYSTPVEMRVTKWHVTSATLMLTKGM